MILSAPQDTPPPESPIEEDLSPKQIVYLWGAGATQGEITYLGAANVNLGMQDSDLGLGLSTRIVQQLPAKWRAAFMTDKGTDIEKLISLLAASGTTDHESLAADIRRLYFEDICATLASAKILETPTLAMGLLNMHEIDSFQEHEILTGIITTNHDGLLQLACQRVYGHVNLGIAFVSADISSTPEATAPLLQVHGSFTWTFGIPLQVSLIDENSSYSPDAVWIPPAILKESKSYPFNKLSGLSYELLSKQCDVLRIVGSSLTQNDWNILSMIFNAQRHRESNGYAPFRVELIMPQPSGDAITRDCSYLRNLIPIGQLTDGDFAGYLSADITSDMRNPLFYWLKEKVQFHRRRGHLGTAPLPDIVAEIAGGVT